MQLQAVHFRGEFFVYVHFAMCFSLGLAFPAAEDLPPERDVVGWGLVRLSVLDDRR